MPPVEQGQASGGRQGLGPRKGALNKNAKPNAKGDQHAKLDTITSKQSSRPASAQTVEDLVQNTDSRKTVHASGRSKHRSASEDEQGALDMYVGAYGEKRKNASTNATNANDVQESNNTMRGGYKQELKEVVEPLGTEAPVVEKAMPKSRLSRAAPAQDRSSSPSIAMPPPMHHTNPALTLPTVNFGFDELRDQMNRFTLRFDEFIEKGRRRLLEEKNEFARNVAEDKESAREMRAQVGYYKEKEREVEEQSHRESTEVADAQSTITTMTRTHNTLLATQHSLTAHLANLTSNLTSLRAHKVKQRNNLTTLSTQNTPELNFWESSLGLRIEGAGVPDHLKIVFTHVDERDWEREFSFVVSLEGREYLVVMCRPKLKEEWVGGVVERLNGSRGFGGFLKEMRGGFVELVKQEVERAEL